MVMISSGSETLDTLLGGGIHSGMITDVYGESGAGKTQLCFTLAVNCIKNGGKVMFVDTAGTFRPERIMEIGGMWDVLEKITYLRALVTADQINAIQKIADLDPQLVIIDTVTGLFSVEYSGPSRHLAVMNHLRNLAMAALASRCAVVVTNMVRNVPTDVVDQPGRNVAHAISPVQQREYLGSSVSIYSHIKLKLEIIDAKSSMFRAKLVQPPRAAAIEFGISTLGISDLA
jgi:RecA/RadA recombinase